MAERLDPRRHPFRDDLAAAYLKDRAGPVRLVRPAAMQVCTEVAAIRARPEPDAMQISELLFGEPVDVYEDNDGWSWCQGGLDGYVGYVETASLAAPGPAATHMVSARLSHVFPEPSIKLRPAGRLTLGARIAVRSVDGRFAALEGGGHVIASHLRRIGDPESDPLAVALRCIGAPYLWGGRSSHGLDCSGLVQVAHQACGLLPPRDSDMQAAELGDQQPLPGGPERLARNDVVYFPGHCMIADGEGGLVHANATHMMVTHEPASVVFERTRGGWGSVTHVRRAAMLAAAA
ncbi:MAG: NlpC/P60 family protein [Minwuia sp.]|uniref:C40 family peptidase n=1 Tax=Minwuia sp. TaxID=2493630 RepID=UPI003A899E69